MPKISINILTKNRAELLRGALASVDRQTFRDFEVIIIDDGSTDGTNTVPGAFKHLNIQTFKHQDSIGIIKSRQEALTASQGDYIAILDDDDEWIDRDKLKKQAEFLDKHPNYILVGGGIIIRSDKKAERKVYRPESDKQIKRAMLFRNNFFTSTVMFRREAALRAGGFISDGIDLAEDYDLWLRLGKVGKMHNFREVFTAYRASGYNKERFWQFLAKQGKLIGKHKTDYPYYFIASAILGLRLKFLIPNS